MGNTESLSKSIICLVHLFIIEMVLKTGALKFGMVNQNISQFSFSRMILIPLQLIFHVLLCCWVLFSFLLFCFPLSPSPLLFRWINIKKIFLKPLTDLRVKDVSAVRSACGTACFSVKLVVNNTFKKRSSHQTNYLSHNFNTPTIPRPSFFMCSTRDSHRFA